MGYGFPMLDAFPSINKITPFSPPPRMPGALLAASSGQRRARNSLAWTSSMLLDTQSSIDLLNSTNEPATRRGCGGFR